MLKLIISNNSLLQPLYENIGKYADINHKILTEINCINEIKNGDFDIALVSPLIYSMVFTLQNYRIIPDKMLVLEDYSNAVTISITKNKDRLQTIYFSEINEYIIATTKLLLSERFGIIPTIVEDINVADLIVTYGEQIEDRIDIDLSEDWYDTFEIPLVIGFWIVNQDKFPQNTLEIVNSIARENLPKIEIITENELKNEPFSRQGSKFWNWKEDCSHALEKISDMLFYHNYANHIADIKLFDEKCETFNNDN